MAYIKVKHLSVTSSLYLSPLRGGADVSSGILCVCFLLLDLVVFSPSLLYVLAKGFVCLCIVVFFVGIIVHSCVGILC